MTSLDPEVARYMALPYRIELVPDAHGWFVRMPELPGCISQGDTQEEALAMIRDAQQLWLRGALEDGWTIPEPRSEEYSGKFNVRVPRYVHRDLVFHAREQGVSLNLLAATALARATVTAHPASGEIVGRPVAANGRQTRDPAAPAGILEELGTLYQKLVAAHAHGSESATGDPGEFTPIVLEYKDIRARADALIAKGAIQPAWVSAALEDAGKQVDLVLVDV